jgi:hypothetical protein
MTKILKRAQYKKWKIIVHDTDNVKGIWADFKIKRSEQSLMAGYTNYKYTIEETIDEAKDLIDLIEKNVKLAAK